MIGKNQEKKGFELGLDSQAIKAIIIAFCLITAMALSALPASALLDLLNPQNASYSQTRSISFEYYVNMENATNCTLIIDSAPAGESLEIVSHGFNTINASLTIGSHSWQIGCSDANATEVSEVRTVNVDNILPTIVLFSPLNDTKINTSNLEISFVTLDNEGETLQCEIAIDSSLAASINPINSQPISTTLTNLTDGIHQWNVSCTDIAGNVKTSDTRTVFVNTTCQMPTFTMILSRSQFVIGESGTFTLNAPEGTTVRVETCPDQPGFVSCNLTLDVQYATGFPMERYVPYTLKEGKYIIEAYFTYNNFSERKRIKFNVTNNIIVDIREVDNPRKNDPIILHAEASGGIGDLSYVWQLSNGTKVNNYKANITYTAAGLYTNIIMITDSQNNTKNTTMELDVKDSILTTIVLKDSQTNAPVPHATVELDSEVKDTDSNGQASFASRGGFRDIIVLKENYSIYRETLNITKESTLTIMLDPLNKTIAKPAVTLLVPENNSFFSGTETELVFKASHPDRLNCSTYINEENDNFAVYLGSIIVEKNDLSEKSQGVKGLENISYSWRVECIDTKGNSGISENRILNVGPNQAMAAQLVNNDDSDMINIRIKEYEQLLQDYQNLPADVKEAADAFGITKQVEYSLKTLKNYLRDAEAISLKPNMGEQEMQREQDKLKKNVDDVYQKTPVSIEVIKSENYVDYIKNEDLESLLDTYLELVDGDYSSINKDRLLEYIQDLQQEIVISTKAKVIHLTLRDGTEKDISGVIRSIKTYNLSKDTFIIEIVPKDVAESSDEIISDSSFEVLKKDPVIKFRIQGDMNIVYYVAKNIDTSALKNAKTALFIDPSIIEPEKITGFSVRDIGMPKLSNSIFIPIIVILLGGLLFAGIKYDGIKVARYAIYSLQKKKSLHYMNVILNDIEDNVAVGNIEKAVVLYDEARAAYRELSSLAKNESYDRVVEAAKKIEAYQDKLHKDSKANQLRDVVFRIDVLLNNSRIKEALEEYKNVESQFNSLDEDTKELFHPCLVDLGNKISIMISSSHD